MSVDEIRAALEVFLQPGQVSGILALASDDQLIDGRQCVSFVSADLDELAREAARRDAGEAKAVWFVPNPLRPDMARRRNVSIRAVDALARHWLLIDVDSVRALGHEDDPANQSEKEAAWSVLDACRGTLDGYGMSGAVVGDSGNGWHLCYPILLSNDKPAWDLIRSVLIGLGDRWDTESAKLDRKTFDAARKWKMYGTTPRKGTATEERPYRPAWLVDGPPWCEERAGCNTEILRGLPAQWQAEADLRKGRPTGTSRERDHNYTLECARNYVAKEPPAVSGQGGHDRTFHVASILVEGFGLTSEGDFFSAIGDWNAGCQPPWSEQELRHKFESAMAKVDPARKGYLLKAQNGYSGRSTSGDLPPPQPVSPDDVATIDDLIRSGAEISWLWPGWIQTGVLTAIAAEAGTGKTRFCADLVRRIRHGLAWPDDAPMQLPSDAVVLWVVSDNHHDEMVSLSLAFGIKDAVRINASKADPYGGVTLDTPVDVAALESRIQAVRPVLVVIDTVGNATDHNLSKQEEAKAFYQPLQTVARRQRVAILCLTHLNSGGTVLGRRALEKVRVCLRLERPHGQDRRKLEVIKSNSKYPDALGVTMLDDGNSYDNDPPEPQEEGFDPQAARRARTKADEACDWLKQLLSNGEARRVSQLRFDAELDGINVRWLYAARDRLGVTETIREGRKWWQLTESHE